MRVNPRGRAVIINNKTFQRKARVRLEERRGSDRDLEMLQAALEGLHYSTETYIDLSAQVFSNYLSSMVANGYLFTIICSVCNSHETTVNWKVVDLTIHILH